MTHYTVSWGDTLLTIAYHFDIEPDEIKYINHLNNIYVGQILSIPNSNSRIIQNKQVNIKKSLEYYLKRHAQKKHIFSFYPTQKSHQ